MRDQGLEIAERPESEMPSMPHDLTELDDRSLMVLYSEVTAWAEFAESQAACAVIDEKHAARVAEATYRDAVEARRAEGLNVTDARNQAKGDAGVLAAENASFEAEAYRRLVDSVAKRCERDAALVSRELTRRTAGAERTRRAGSTWTT